MTELGWISLHRKLLDNPIFKDSYTLHLWIYLLLRASHKKTSFMMNGEVVTLNRGQLVFGIRSCSRDTGITPKRIRHRLALLESYTFTARQRAHTHSIVTILNYDKYQSREEVEGHTKGHAEGTPRATYNNDNNINNKYSQQAEEIYSAYPKKADRNNSIKSIAKLLKAGIEKETLLRAIDNYKKLIEKNGTERTYIIQSNNFFGRAERYKEYLEVTEEKEMNPIARAMQRVKERGDI